MLKPLQPSFNIGLDGRAFSSPAGGVRRYITELVAALRAVDPAVDLVAVGGLSGCDIPAGVRVVSASSWIPTNLGWSIEGLPRAYRHLDLDVFHAPAYTAPLWGVHPLVVTLHDVSYERHPEWYPYRLDPFRRAFYRLSALAADTVITDSEFSRQEIHAAYGIGVEKIVVVPLGVGTPFTPADDRAPAAAPTILHVGDLHVRRNVGVLVDALAALRQQSGLHETTLVLAGTDRGSATPLLAQATRLHVDNAIRFVPRPDDRAVLELMHTASVFAYPSRYEGFGLPALEAMACGLPVVASNAASIPEVVGDAGLLVDPHDVSAWQQALTAVLTSSERTAAMRDAGIRRAATFTWERTARETLAVYRGTAGRN